jgi:hypothetical protein
MHFCVRLKERATGDGGERGAGVRAGWKRERDLLVRHSGALLRCHVVAVCRRCSSSGVRLCVSAYSPLLVKALLVEALLVKALLVKALLVKALLVLLLPSTPVCLPILSAPLICVGISFMCRHS